MSRVSLGTYRSWPSAVAISMSVIGAQAYSRLPSRSPVRVAERVGFEPTVAINHTAFRERHLQPLGHLSGSVEYRGGYRPGPHGQAELRLRRYQEYQRPPRGRKASPINQKIRKIKAIHQST